MTTLTIAAVDAAGAPLAHHVVEVAVIAGRPGGHPTAGGPVIAAPVQVRLDETGTGEVEVTPTSDLDQPGAWVRCTVLGSSPTIVRSLTIPDVPTVDWADPALQVADPIIPEVGITHQDLDHHVWRQTQRVRLPVPIDGSITPFLAAEVADPSDPNVGAPLARMFAAGLPVPGVGPFVAGGVEIGEWNPFAGAFSGRRALVVHTMIGVDGSFQPVYRTMFRAASPGQSLFDASPMAIQVADPTYPDDAATRRYVDAAAGGMSWSGDWSGSETYPAMAVVRHDGAVWVTPTGATAGATPGVAGAWEMLGRTAPPQEQVLPVGGQQGWMWPDDLPTEVGRTDDDDPIFGGPAYDLSAIHHECFIPAETASTIRLGLTPPNPGVGVWADTAIEVVNTSPEYCHLFHAGTDAEQLGSVQGLTLSLWRLVVIGTATADPIVSAARLSVRTL